MNCLILALLLLCRGNNEYGSTSSYADNGCGCGSRIEPRSFISYQSSGCGSTCGCEEQQNGCDCCK